MRKRVLDDVGTALLALVLALVVWVNATYQGDKPREGRFPENPADLIPITYLNSPPDLVATNNPATGSEVRIKAFSSSWDALEIEDFAVTAELGGLAEGVHAVPVTVSCTDSTVTILSVDPNTLWVNLERIERKPKEVVVSVLDEEEVPLGYRVYSPDVVPESIWVEGPSTAVNAVSHLEASISIADERETVVQELTPLPVDENGARVTGVKLGQQKVTVTIVIEKKQNYREVAVRVRTQGHPARGYFVSGVELDPTTITVVGPPTTIDGMGGLVDLQGTIDVNGATRTIERRIALALPEGVSVVGAKEGETPTVFVVVGVDAVTGGTTVELPLSVKKLRTDLVAKLSVPAVDVILTGPAVLLDELATDALEAFLDLSALGPGTYQVKPDVDFLVPQDSPLRDLAVSDISPKSVEVTISEPPTATPSPTLGTPTLALTPPITETLSISLTPTGALTVEAVPTMTLTIDNLDETAPSPTMPGERNR